MGEVTGFESARGAMVADLRSAGIADPRVLAAMAEVPRERFVEPGDEHYAYDDGPLPIAAGQTISQPYIVALMIEAAGVGPGARVLEVGAGSGYAAAVIGRIAREVIALERHRTLADQAAARIAALGYTNVAIHHADGAQGWPEAAPYDAILAAAAAERVPEALKAQLAEGGTLVLPVGGRHEIQRLLKLTRRGEDFAQQDLGPVRFVPLVGGA